MTAHADQMIMHAINALGLDAADPEVKRVVRECIAENATLEEIKEAIGLHVERQGRVAVLIQELMKPVASHLQRGQPGRVRVYDLLNALGSVTAVVIHGTRGDAEAISFFNDCLSGQLRELAGAAPDPKDGN